MIDELRVFDSRSIAVAAADVGRGGLARAIDAFSAQWQTSVAGFIEAGDAWGDHLVSSAAEYEAADRASASALDAVLTSRDG
ncbi:MULTISPECIES: hypothetical protein [unclassified Saccharopolyspora]|uniref:hypothetical protein n=1 Tax=unclassified Saccharopolyspora TaxID=2646250 RepID=UPI001CD7E3ED|nr:MULTISPECIES: hypothetical protein [unclassified Saccharopolyspora]MCA1189023.1 hypothetical protein [Saccharopolyspora sp. 6T]MCA1191224.1 hypothetical protein [Saccharopolyspora sp. 6V]MCA1228887.1 hypothetical protein [Saccharopolyspora sp. 6M]MCA1281929.1 hypothetical protein [Saccharopolyspora sp. 7B]